MEAALLEFVAQHPAYAYLAVFGVLLACGLGIPLPEDITLVAGGFTVYLAGVHGLSGPSLVPMIAVGLLGVLSGDTMLFMLGRWLGPRATQVRPFRRLFTPKRLEKIRTFFRRYGALTAFFARFAPGVRAPTYLLAGSMGMRFRTFFTFDALASLISVPLLVWLAWRFGAHIERVKNWLATSRYALIGLLLAFGIYVMIRMLRARRRAAAGERLAANPSDDPADDERDPA